MLSCPQLFLVKLGYWLFPHSAESSHFPVVWLSKTAIIKQCKKKNLLTLQKLKWPEVVFDTQPLSKQNKHIPLCWQLITQTVLQRYWKEGGKVCVKHMSKKCRDAKVRHFGNVSAYIFVSLLSNTSTIGRPSLATENSLSSALLVLYRLICWGNEDSTNLRLLSFCQHSEQS